MEKQDKNEIVEIIDSYKEIESSMLSLENKMNQLVEIKNKLIVDLDSIKKREITLLLKLKDKYKDITYNEILKIYNDEKNI